MLETLAQMAALIVCGTAWRVWRPHGLSADLSRNVLTALVYYFLLPALVMEVLWKTPLDLNSLRISGVAVSSIVLTTPLIWFFFKHVLRQPGPVTGALVLAAVFSNVSYLGLPVLEAIFGPWARSVAIQYDLFASLPLLLTAGVLFAQVHGSGPLTNPFSSLLKVPPLWAAAGGAALSAMQIPLPDWLADWLQLLGRSVVPLMLIALGMGLRWETVSWRSGALLIPVVAVQLLLLPYVVLHLAAWSGLQGDWFTATVLEAAMPSMVFGIVLCDRYHLDSSLYAAAVTVSTLLSLVTLPLWYEWAG